MLENAEYTKIRLNDFFLQFPHYNPLSKRIFLTVFLKRKNFIFLYQLELFDLVFVLKYVDKVYAKFGITFGGRELRAVILDIPKKYNFLMICLSIFELIFLMCCCCCCCIFFYFLVWYFDGLSQRFTKAVIL